MNKNSRLGLWLVIPAWALDFAARTAQICAGTDMTTGFLKRDNGFFMDACFWLAVGVTLIASIAAAVCDRKKGSALYTTEVSRVTDGRAGTIGFGLLLPAMGALYSGYAEAVIPEESNISPSPFMMIVNFLFGGIMLVSAFVILYKKEFRPGLGFSLTAGAAYYTLCGIGVFLDNMAVTTVPEHLINCLCMAAAAVFFMQLASLLSGNEGKHTRGALAVSGAVSAVMILGSSLAVFASYLMGPAETASRIVTSKTQAEMLYQMSHGDHAYYMSLVPVQLTAAGVFIVMALVALYMKPSDKPAETESAAEPAVDAVPEPAEQAEPEMAEENDGAQD